MVWLKMKSGSKGEKENRMKLKLYIISVVGFLKCILCLMVWVCVFVNCSWLALISSGSWMWKLPKLAGCQCLLCCVRIGFPMKLCKKRRTLPSVYSCYLMEGVRVILRFLWCGLYRVVRWIIKSNAGLCTGGILSTPSSSYPLPLQCRVFNECSLEGIK